MKMLLIILLIFSGFHLLLHADPATMNEKAGELFRSSGARWGTADGIQENITRPMTSEEPLVTVDGTPFGAQLNCNTKDAFLELAVLPGKTGDLDLVIFKQDTTGDGEFDYNGKLPVHISGVCGNGFISCDPGTWDNCQAYEWNVKDHILSVEVAPLKDLGGCYCINTSCGKNLVWINLNEILNHLATAAAGALAVESPDYAISDMVTRDSVVTVFGQSVISCSDKKTLPDSGYTGTPAKLNSDAFAAAADDELYQLIFSSKSGAASSRAEFQTCTLRRRISINETALDEIIEYDSGSGKITLCGPDCLRLVLGRVGDNYWSAACGHFQHSVSFNVIRPDRIKSATLVQAKWDDWINVLINGSKIYAGPYDWDLAALPSPCELGTDWLRNPDVDFTDFLKTPGRKDFSVNVIVSGAGEGYAYAEIHVDTDCFLEDDAIHDSCRAWKDDPDCDLYEETKDGVTTVRDFYTTGLKSLVQTRDVVGRTCRFTVRRPWFEISRVYRCRNRKDYTFDDALDRNGVITESTSETGYRDKITVDGKSVWKTGKLLLPADGITVDHCTKACKTRKAVPDNDAGHSGVVGHQTVDKIRYQVVYKSCQNSSCPVEDDEEIVEDCQCLEEFSSALTAMQAIRMAGGDAICSDGVKKP